MGAAERCKEVGCNLLNDAGECILLATLEKVSPEQWKFWRQVVRTRLSNCERASEVDILSRKLDLDFGPESGENQVIGHEGK
jgi:hypothetical protein